MAPVRTGRQEISPTSRMGVGIAMSTKKTEKHDADLQHVLPGIAGSLYQREQLAIISRIPAHAQHEELLVTNYQPDRAIREAVLAPAENWKPESDSLAYA